MGSSGGLLGILSACPNTTTRLLACRSARYVLRRHIETTQGPISGENDWRLVDEASADLEKAYLQVSTYKRPC